MNLPKQIKESRVNLGLSQGELAYRSGVGLATVQNIEGGRANPEVTTVEKILHQLGLALSITRLEVDWHLWASLGVPSLNKSAKGALRADQGQLMIELPKMIAAVLSRQLSDREQQALVSFLCALRDHFPKTYRRIRAKNRKPIEEMIGKYGRPKLRRIALAHLKDYL